MKRLFLTVVLAAAGWCAYAQNYMIVDSEKIFKSIDAYNTAIKDLDKMAEDYQKQHEEPHDRSIYMEEVGQPSADAGD